MSKTLMIAAAALASTLGAQAFAANPTHTPAIDARAIHQQERIVQGEKSGTLTHREAARLDHRQARLESHIAAAKADGVVTAGERRHLRREEHRNSHVIHRLKHNHRHA